MSNDHTLGKDIYVVIEHLRGQVSDISYVMLAAARELADASGGQVVGILLGHNCRDLASTLGANRVLYLEHPTLAEFASDAYIRALDGLLRDGMPRAVMFGSTTIGGDVANALSIRFNLPLVGLCQSFGGDGRYVSQIYGGKMMVEGALPEPSVIVTMIPGGYKPEQGRSEAPPAVVPAEVKPLGDLRVSITGYIEPDAGDVDIANEPVLIAVGRGIQTEDNIELAEELAELLGGTVCASRPVVDQGWLPPSRMVGKSGKTVKPKLYLAMGISGAPEHVEGIVDSETIIAVNTDPAAPIFDIAKFGADIDMLDLMEVMIELIEDL